MMGTATAIRGTRLPRNARRDHGQTAHQVRVGGRRPPRQRAALFCSHRSEEDVHPVHLEDDEQEWIMPGRARRDRVKLNLWPSWRNSRPTSKPYAPSAARSQLPTLCQVALLVYEDQLPPKLTREELKGKL